MIKKARILDVWKIYKFCRDRSEEQKELHDPIVLRPLWYISYLLFGLMDCLIYLDKGKVIGSVFILNRQNKYSLGIIVDELYQGKGIGTKLVSEILKKDYPKISLNVAKDNYSAIKLYKKFGFVLDEERISMRRKGK